MEINKHQN